MNKKIYFIQLGILAVILFFTSCNPYMDEKPEAGSVLPPSAADMDFSITPQSDGFRFALAYTKPQIKGIYQVSWDLGNGETPTGEKITAYYPLQNSYKVKMTVKTNMGSTTIEKTITTTKTDYSIFTDPTMIALSGGIEALNGKSWVLDMSTRGFIGVGPSDNPAGTGMEWWAASPGDKSGTGLVDDEINFKLNGFAVTYNNNGVSYVKGYRKDDAALAGFYKNPRLNQDDYDVDYATPATGTWSMIKKADGNYLKLSGSKPIFPCFDVGAKDNEYKIIQASANLLELTCFSSYEAWTRWHYLLIPKGYVKPMVKIDIDLGPGTGTNTYQVSFANANIPAGQSISKVSINFGDGTIEEKTSYSSPVSHTFMRKGVYVVNVTVVASSGNITKSIPVTVTTDHPNYVPFLLEQMVVYNDFSEVIMAQVNGQDCTVSTVANPSKVYPNKSSFVARYSKTNNEWANAYLQLPAGYRFDLRKVNTFKIMVYGKAGDKVLMKLENTDRGGNAWQTGTADLIYTIKSTNTWEVAEYKFAGVSAGWDWTGDIFTGNVVTDNRFNQNFYNVVRIMLNPGVATGTHTFWFDELAGPHVEGLKSATIPKK
jgi:PKD repeat protein